MPDDVLDAFMAPSLRFELFQEAFPYVYDTESETLQHQTQLSHHVHPEMLLPENREKFDGKRLAKVTTWDP